MPCQIDDGGRPTVVVHHRDHARAALIAAAEANLAVALLSPPGFAGYAGPLYFREMCSAAREDVPEADFVAILDCGDAAGQVLAALRAGIATVVFTGAANTFDRLADLANRQDAQVVRRPSDVLDLASVEDAAEALAAWVRGASK